MKIIAQLVSKPILNKHASKSICTKFQPSATFCARITNAYWTKAKINRAIRHLLSREYLERGS